MFLPVLPRQANTARTILSRIPWLLPYVLLCEDFFFWIQHRNSVLYCSAVLFQNILNFFSYCCFPSLDIIFLFLIIPSEKFFDASSHSSLPLSVYFSYYTALDQQFCTLCTSVLMSGSHNPSC